MTKRKRTKKRQS